MANRMKEDEKNDKIIRDLLKLPANRRCINCNSLGPQYVCTNFWTFVCKTCRGIHREFTHRVESVSMAKFTSQEVSALQGGGNERAKEVFFRDLDSQRHSVPDSSNVERLRDFIKHCYVDRRYIGERSLDKPPRSKMGDKEDSIESRRVDAYRSGSRIPPYEDTNDHHYGERPGPAGRNDERSPGYGQETRYGDSRKSPVDDWRRDDRFGNARRSKQRRFSDGESKLEVRSPDSQKDLGVSSSPLVRPVRDILGEHGPQLRIGEPHKANGGKIAEGFTHSQRTASSSSLGSIDGNPVEPKKETLASLIDFDADPEPPNVGVPPAQPVTTPTSQSVTHPTTSPSSDGGNWASFDFTPQAQVHTPAPPSANSLDSVLLQLSAPSTTPFGNMPTAAVTGNISTLPISGGVAAGPGGNMSTLPVSGGFSAVAPGGMMPTMDVGGGESFFRANEGGQWSGMQQQQQQQHKQQRHQPSLFAATDSRSIAPQFTSSVGGATNNQPWNSQAQNVQGPLATTGQPSSSGGFTSQPASLKAKRTGSEALPEDLFAATYSAYPEPVQSWHTGPSHGMGYGVQYPTAVAMPSFTHQSKPAKQFDFYNEPTMVHAQSEPMDDLPLPIAQTPMSRRKGKEPIEKPMDMEEEEEESAGEEQPDNEDDDDVDDSYDDDDLDGGGEYSQRTEDDEDSEKYRKKRKVKNWTEPATLVLLNAWRDRSLQRGRKNQRGIKNVRSDEWVEIAKTVSRASDTIRTHTQCKNRLHHLKKKYKQERMKSQVTRTWVYFNQMDMLMQLGKPQKRTRKHIEGQMKRQIRLALKDLDQEDLGYLDGLTPEVYLRNLRELVFLMACRVTSAVVPVSPTPIPCDDTLIPWEHNTILEMIQIGMKEVKGSLICTRCQSIHIAKVDWREGFLCLASYLLGNLFKEGDNSLWAPPSNNNFSVPCILCGEGLSVPCSTTNGSWDWLFLALTHSVCLCPHEAIVGYLRGQRINISSEASQERILLKFYVNIITQLDPTNGWNLFRP